MFSLLHHLKVEKHLSQSEGGQHLCVHRLCTYVHTYIVCFYVDVKALINISKYFKKHKQMWTEKPWAGTLGMKIPPGHNVTSQQ